MAAVMAVQAGLVYQVQYDTAIAHAAGIGGAAMLFVFQGAFTIGFQATVWVYPSEILPLRLRQKGSSISTASNWICNFIIVMITPDAISNIGWKTYIIFAVLNVSCSNPLQAVPIGAETDTQGRPPGYRSSTFSIPKARVWNSKTLTGCLRAKMLSRSCSTRMKRRSRSTSGRRRRLYSDEGLIVETTAL